MRLRTIELCFCSILTAIILTSRGEAADKKLLGDGGPAKEAVINGPIAIAVSPSGVLYVAERFRNVVRRVDLATGLITTQRTMDPVAPIGGMVLDKNGDLIISEFTKNRIKKISTNTGAITTLAGIGDRGFSGDGGPAVNAALNGPQGLAVDVSGNVFFADAGNHRIRRIDAATDTITTVAGCGKRDSSGDDGPASRAGVEWPASVAVDATGNLFVAQSGYAPNSHRIRRIDSATGIIRDNSPALSGQLGSPGGLLIDARGKLLVIDHDRIRRIDSASRVIDDVAGSVAGFSGDGGPATSARLNAPSAIALDADGNLFIAEFVNNRIRRVDCKTATIRTVAGSGLPHRVDILR